MGAEASFLTGNLHRGLLFKDGSRAVVPEKKGLGFQCHLLPAVTVGIRGSYPHPAPCPGAQAQGWLVPCVRAREGGPAAVTPSKCSGGWGPHPGVGWVSGLGHGPGSVSWSFSRRAGDRRARQQRKGQRPGGLETHPGRRARSFETWEGDRSRGFSQTGTEEGEPQRGSPAPCDCAGAVSLQGSGGQGQVTWFELRSVTSVMVYTPWFS